LNNPAKIFFIIGLIILISVGCRQIKENRIKNKLNAAIELKDQNRFEEALAIVREAQLIDSNEIRVYIEMGKINNLSGRHADALKSFYKAISLDPSNILSLFQQGITYAFLEKYDSAISYYNRAIGQKGNDSLYFELNRNFTLENDAIEFEVDMPTIRYYRGMAFYFSKMLSNALSDFNFCLSEGYNEGGAYFYLGLIAISNGDKSVGCEDLRLAVENHYDEAKAYLAKYCK
jgi:tetratricopeptide (TPR) repeat protein